MKKEFLIIFLFFISLTGFSQLTVRNTSYIFAKNVVLFVEDDVNLKEVTTHLYLRDESQLIQGTGTTGNSGQGQLSVYQEGTVDNYAYNYWCSPVGNTDADNTLNRAFRANNNMYDHIGDVVTPSLDPITSALATFTSGYDGTSSPLIISDFWIYKYTTGVAYSDWDFVGSTGEVVAGYGFSMKGTIGCNQLYDFRGKPNKGEITIPVIAEQETLIGNPFPAALDALEYIHDPSNTAMYGSLYFWEHDASVNSHYVKDYVGGYASLTISMDGSLLTFEPATFNTYDNSGNTISTGPASITVKRAERYIPIGQGFMIKGKTTGFVYLKNSFTNFEKEATGISEFFKSSSNKKDSSSQKLNKLTSEGFRTIPNDYKRFRLNIDFNDTHTRQILQNFHNSATEGYDRGLEIVSLEEISNDVYWVLDGKPFVAQAFNFEKELTIPLVVKLEETQSLRFRIVDIQNIEDSQPIFLHDIENNIYYNLRINNPEFTINKGEYLNKFEITFINDTTLEVEENLITKITIYQNNVESLFTILKPVESEIESVLLFDFSGKLVLEKTNFSSSKLLTFSTENLSTGAYIANIKVANSLKIISKKIFIEN